MAKLPIFAAGDYEKIQPAIDSGMLTYPAYVYARDKKMLVFIDRDLSINEVGEGNTGSIWQLENCIINGGDSNGSDN